MGDLLNWTAKGKIIDDNVLCFMNFHLKPDNYSLDKAFILK